MTIEEIKNTPELVDDLLDDNMTARSREKIHKRLDEVCNLAIKALEQETVSKDCYDHEYFLRKEFEIKIARLEQTFDKIRAEIEQEIIPRNSDQYDHEAMWQNCGLRIALKVIDKYKAESEDKE